MATKVLNIPYAIDLGNGFTKRTNGKEVIIEPSLIEYVSDFFSSKKADNTFKHQDSSFYRLGNDADTLNAESALGEDDQSRYDTKEFKEMLYGFIAKDFKQSIVIPLLVTGLPVNHFKAKEEDLVKMITGKKIIKLDDEKEIVIDIKRVEVIPQPMGTYIYLVNLEKIDPDTDTTLIVDGGHGTLDITEMKGYRITRKAGAELGVKEAHIDIYNFLVDKYSGSKHLSLANMPNIMRKGLLHDGSVINVAALKEVKAIVQRHFDRQYKFIKDSGFNVGDYNQVVFTGGSAELHKEVIEEKQNKNFIVLEDAQITNVQGYYEYGKAVL